MSPIQKAIRTFMVAKQLFGDTGKPVPQELAQKRSDVCLKCPMNTEMPVWELFADTAAEALKRQLQLKNDMELRVNGEEDLHICKPCLCVLSLKVWKDLKFILGTSSTDELDPDCWILKEQQNLQNHDNKIDRIHE